MEKKLMSRKKNWWDAHVWWSQYLSRLWNVVTSGVVKTREFIFQCDYRQEFPPPLPVVQRDEGRTQISILFLQRSWKVNNILHHSATFHTIPYDLCCSSVQYALSERICRTCQQYFASVVMLWKTQRRTNVSQFQQN